MAEAEEGEITENEISEEEEKGEEQVTDEELKQMSKENDLLMEDINKTDDQKISEADNEEDDEEDTAILGEKIGDATEEEEMATDDTTAEVTEDEATGEEQEDGTDKEIENSVEETGKETEKPPESQALKGRIDEKTLKKLEQVEKEVNEAANSIYILKSRAEELLNKEKMTENEEKELEWVNAELKRQMDLFDEKTKEIQDIIANSNILEAMPVRLPQVKHEEDVLPRVIFCGEVEDYVPKVVVCDQKSKSKGSSGVTRECTPECSGNSPPPSAISPPKKKIVNDQLQTAKSVESSDLGKIRSMLEQDISNKDKILDDLKLNLESLQKEIKLVSAENTELSARLKKLHQSQAKQKQQSCMPSEPKKMCPSLMAAKLQQYTEYARKLEKQLAEMESDFNNVHREICAAQKERDRLEQSRNAMNKPSCNKK